MYFDSRPMLVAVILSLSLMISCVSAEQKAKIQELRQLAAEIPKLPDFEQVDYSDISKPENTVVAYFYHSSASYVAVKSFYTTELAARGWSSPLDEPITNWGNQNGSRRLVFNKGNYTIDVEYEAGP